MDEPFFAGVDDLKVFFGEAVFLKKNSDVKIGIRGVFNNANEVRVVRGKVFETLV